MIKNDQIDPLIQQFTAARKAIEEQKEVLHAWHTQKMEQDVETISEEEIVRMCDVEEMLQFIGVEGYEWS